MWPLRPKRRAEAALALLLLASARAPAASGAIEIAVGARSIQPGELTVFTMTTTEPVDSMRLRAFDRDIPAFQDSRLTWRAIVGVDLGVAPKPIRGSRREDREASGSRHYDLRGEPRHFPTRTLSVDEAFVSPPPLFRNAS